jgi:NADPH:quinone reductase-like Zn-dependent oxidoreductase
MKAIVVHEYGGPEVLKYEEYADPVAGAGEVVVRVAATSVNPADYKQRAGLMKDGFPIDFPGVIGLDVSGTIVSVGPEAHGFAVGDPVFGMANHTYAQLCVVKATNLAHIPEGLDMAEAAALPTVTTTGSELISLGTGVTTGQTVLVSGAVGNVGRSAVFTAKVRGAVVLAGVRKKQLQEAASLGADQLIATDDPEAMNGLAQLDAVADTVGGKTAEELIAKVKRGGVFASVLGVPQNAKDYPTVRVVPVYVRADAKILQLMATAVKDGKLVIPIGPTIALKDAAKAHAVAEKGGIGKVLLVA